MNQLHIHHRVNETERLITAERHGMLQYACYRLGNLDDAEDAITLLALSCVRRVMLTSTSFANTAGRGDFRLKTGVVITAYNDVKLGE